MGRVMGQVSPNHFCWEILVWISVLLAGNWERGNHGGFSILEKKIFGFVLMGLSDMKQTEN